MQAIRIAMAAMHQRSEAIPQVSPAVESLVRQVIAQVADKWTMLVLEALEEHGTLRFTEVGRIVGGISQKMLTKTLREMERDGLVTRTVHPVIPPHVDYTLTELGRELSAAFCGVWALPGPVPLQSALPEHRHRERSAVHPPARAVAACDPV